MILAPLAALWAPFGGPSPTTPIDPEAPLFSALVATIRGRDSLIQCDPGVGGFSGTLSLRFLPDLGLGLCDPGTNVAGGVNLLAVVRGTLAAAPQDVNLKALSDPWGIAPGGVAMARVKLLVLHNLSSSLATPIAYGPGPSAGWGISGSVPEGVAGTPGIGLVASTGLRGIPVTDAERVLRLDPGAATIPFALFLMGADT